jgi:NAD-dependent deacetylase
MSLVEAVQTAAEMFRQSNYVIALTGAGISTPSGVPDFRSHGDGLWEKANPMEVASLYGFRYNPQAFYEWIRPLAKMIIEAKPNPAHEALAQLEKMGVLKCIITQNIDLLHSRAGSQTVYEVHGHIREATCMECLRIYPAEGLFRKFLENDNWEVLRCEACRGVLKPNVILFGEQLPMQVMIKAQQETRHADLMVVVGSSLEVFPAADLPRQVKQRGGKVMLINLDETFYDNQADLVIHENCADVLPQIVKVLEGS